MTNTFKLSLLLLVVLLLSSTPVTAQKTETGFLNRSVVVNGSEYRYMVYVPREFTRSRSWPLILFLHGGGSYGSDGMKHTNGGLAQTIRSKPELFPAIVVFPQAHADNTPGWLMEGGKAALVALDQSIKEFNGDTSRVYLTGLSAGGNGAWFLASEHPERFVAAVVLCGFISKFKGRTSGVDHPALAPSTAVDPYAFIAARIGRMPIRIFHGDADESVSVEESRKMFAALKAVGADVQYTELPGLGHSIWDTVYARADLFEWLFKQKR